METAMTDMRGNLDPDAVMTARALETVLLSSSVATAVDERLFEALLRRALDVIPGLGGVFGVPDGLRYRFGKRKEQPDIVARDAEADVGKEYAAGIEVKIRSNSTSKSTVPSSTLTPPPPPSVAPSRYWSLTTPRPATSVPGSPPTRRPARPGGIRSLWPRCSTP